MTEFNSQAGIFTYRWHLYSVLSDEFYCIFCDSSEKPFSFCANLHRFQSSKNSISRASPTHNFNQQLLNLTNSSSSQFLIQIDNLLACLSIGKTTTNRPIYIIDKLWHLSASPLAILQCTAPGPPSIDDMRTCTCNPHFGQPQFVLSPFYKSGKVGWRCVLSFQRCRFEVRFSHPKKKEEKKRKEEPSKNSCTAIYTGKSREEFTQTPKKKKRNCKNRRRRHILHNMPHCPMWYRRPKSSLTPRRTASRASQASFDIKKRTLRNSARC